MPTSTANRNVKTVGVTLEPRTEAQLEKLGPFFKNNRSAVIRKAIDLLYRSLESEALNSQ